MRARRRDREQGASLVEFAFIVPLLTMFLFGIVQFGIAYDIKQSVNSAAREGARFGALPSSQVDDPSSNNDIVRATRAGFQGIGDSAELDVEVFHSSNPMTPLIEGATPCSTAISGNVIVSATVAHELTIPFVGAPTIDITGRGEFRCEPSSTP